MIDVVLYVEPHPTGIGWRVRREPNGMTSRLFSAKAEAVKFAIESGYVQARPNNPGAPPKYKSLEVRVLNDDGDFEVKWVYGRDPNPII